MRRCKTLPRVTGSGRERLNAATPQRRNDRRQSLPRYPLQLVDQSLFWRQATGYCMKTHADVVCRVATSSSRCLATASADTVPALLALDARVAVTGPDGEREIVLEEMYREDGIHYLTFARQDVVTAVQIPARVAG